MSFRNLLRMKRSTAAFAPHARRDSKNKTNNIRCPYPPATTTATTTDMGYDPEMLLDDWDEDESEYYDYNDDNYYNQPRPTSFSNRRRSSNKDFCRRPPSRSTSEDSRCSCDSTLSSISFSETVEVQEISPLSALTDRPEELWYQREEYNMMHTRIRRLAKYAKVQPNNNPSSPQQEDVEGSKKKICTRGLEWMMDDDNSSQKYQARNCVLTAQRLQLDDEGLALAYQEVAKASAAMARERASRDAKEIEFYLRR